MDVKQLSKEVEQVSQSYAEKFSIERDATWFILKLQEEVGELIQSYLMLAGKAHTKRCLLKKFRPIFTKKWQMFFARRCC